MDTTLKILFVTIVVGLLNAAYLSYHTMTHTLVACYFFPDEWCEKVQKSSYSKTFGAPNSYLGFIILTTVLILSWLYSNGTLSFVPSFVVICAGFLFSSYFLYIQAFVLKAFCTWCVISFIVFLMLFVIGYQIL